MLHFKIRGSFRKFFSVAVSVIWLLLLIMIAVDYWGYNPYFSHKTYQGKDPYQVAVYEEMLNLEKVKVSDIEDAFTAYLSTHHVGKYEQKWVRKQIAYMKQHMDHRGFYISPEMQFENLLAYRNPTPNENIQVSSVLAPMTGTILKTIPNPDGKGAWKNIGPFGNPDVQWSATGSGALHYVEMHPTDPSIMYTCARNAGLFKTTDYGAHWENITAHFPTPHMFSVEVNTSNPSIIYLGGKDKLYYSSDEGETWYDRTSIITGEIFDIKSDPTNPDRALIASTQGLFLTTDAGLTWSQKITGNFSDIDLREDFSLMLVTKNDDGTPPVLYYSIDRGDTWIERTVISNLATVDKIYLALHENPAGHDVILGYALVNGNTPSRFIGLWKSSFIENPAVGQDTFNFVEVKHPTYAYPNGAAPLITANNANGFEEEVGDPYGGVNPYTLSTWVGELWISPNDSLKLMTAREKIWGSNDGGIIWEFKPSYGKSNWADNRYITMNMAKDTIFWCNDGGLWCIAESDLFPAQALVDASGLTRSEYMISKVVPKNGNICIQEGAQMDVSLMNKDVFMTGGQDIGQVFERAGRSTHTASADVYRGRIKPTDDQYFITGGLNVSLNDGSTAEVYNSIEADQGNPNRLYGFTRKINGSNEVKLARSPQGVDGWQVLNFKGENQANTGGHSWTPIHDDWEIVPFNGMGITSMKQNTFKQSKANPELAFFGDEIGGRLFFTENLSSADPTWTEITGLPSSDHYRISTHDLYENVVVVGTSYGIYISKDKGKSWFLRPGIPEKSYVQILLDKNEIEGIYVMTKMNVYYHSENNPDWQEFNKGLPLFQNRDLRIGYYEDGDDRIYVGKYGSGVWSSPLQSVLNKNQDLPIADFKIHGNSTDFIEAGNSVKLINLSANATSLQWVIENGSDVITINNEDYPEAVLNTPGYYKVSLTAMNNNGIDVEIKEYYIHVYNNTIQACTPENTNDLVWFKGIKSIELDGDLYSDFSLANYQSKDKIFELSNTDPLHIILKDNYLPGFNYWWKAYIDFNNDGAFTMDELIFDSGSAVDSVNTTFNIPSNATINTPLHFRISGRGSNLEPDSCESNLDVNRQLIDMKVILRNTLSITQTDMVLSPASVELSANYSSGQNINSSGFLLSTVDGNLNKDNSTLYLYAGSLSSNDSYDMVVNDLLPNTIYFYRAFVIDGGLYSYAEKDSFFIPKKDIPLVEAVIALNIGNQELELQGMLFPDNANITSIHFLHGENNFANETAIDIFAYPTDIKQLLNTFVTVPPGTTSYQFKIRVMTAEGNTFYSNIFTTTLNQSYCASTTASPLWYKKWREITLNGTVYNDGGSTQDYEDATQITFDLESGKTYTTTLKHVNSGWHNLTFYVFIDLNNDSDFEDQGELVGSGPPDGQLTNITISIPTRYNLRGKDLRMRVIGNEDNNLDLCTLTIGNVKDFTVHLDRCTPVRVIDMSDFPFLDGKTFWAQDTIRFNGTYTVPEDLQLQLKASSVKIDGSLQANPSSKITVSGDGCTVE